MYVLIFKPTTPTLQSKDKSTRPEERMILIYCSYMDGVFVVTFCNSTVDSFALKYRL